MPSSEAQIRANQANGLKSRGPKTPEGKVISRQNGLKHGMTGKGIVTPEGEQEEIDSRVERFTADMKPRTPAGVVLIQEMATLSLRMKRGGQQELAALAMHVRHAADDFDEERIDRANTLLEDLGEDPRNNLRKLKKMPEGVDRLIEEWQDLRNDLLIDPKPLWTADHLERAANMTGVKTQHARGSQLGALSKTFWGDFGTLAGDEESDIDEGLQRNLAKGQLIERIDTEIASLEAHRKTLDFEMIALDRAEAGERALFIDTKAAALARRYEAEARRGFYKAYKEFQRIETEAAAQAEEDSLPPEPSKLGSSRHTSPPPARKPGRSLLDASAVVIPVVPGSIEQDKRTKPPAKSPG
jgi:hypothetical protein